MNNFIMDPNILIEDDEDISSEPGTQNVKITISEPDTNTVIGILIFIIVIIIIIAIIAAVCNRYTLSIALLIVVLTIIAFAALDLNLNK